LPDLILIHRRHSASSDSKNIQPQFLQGAGIGIGSRLVTTSRSSSSSIFGARCSYVMSWR
jgi:hypothetical protein